MCEPSPSLIGDNDRYSDIDRAASQIWNLTQQAIQDGEVDRISDSAIVDLLTASVKLYAAKAATEAMPFRPLHGAHDEVVTPTEALTATIEILRALNLGPMELGLWSHRKPRNYHLMENPSVPSNSEELTTRQS